MSKAKQQAYQQSSPATAQQYPYPYPPPSSGSFAWGFFLGQLTLAFILFVFIKFFIFGEAPSADARASARAAARRQRTLSHTRQRTLSAVLRPRPSANVLRPRSTDGGLTVQKILEKTYYNVNGHQPESLDWFNVLIAQTIAQLRADALEDEAVLTSLNTLLNGSSRPDFLDEIRVTEISLGEEFPIFSNCRVIPVDENGAPLKDLTGQRGERLQARMDVDLSDVVTLGIETKLVLNYPKPFVAVLPVALAVSVVRFSGTLSLSFSPSSSPAPTQSNPSPTSTNSSPTPPTTNEGHPLNPTGASPTTLTFTFLDDYRLDLSVHSLIGSRSRLQDVPKIAQLVEARIHQWFDDRCVEPRFQQIVLPSLWPRKRNTRGGADDDADSTAEAVLDDSITTTGNPKTSHPGSSPTQPPTRRVGSLVGTVVDAAVQAVRIPLTNAMNAHSNLHATASSSTPPNLGTADPTHQNGIGSGSEAEQRTRTWAASLPSAAGPSSSPNTPTKGTAGGLGGRDATGGKKWEDMTELERAGVEMREAEERARRREVVTAERAARGRGIGGNGTGTGLGREDGGLRVRKARDG